MRPVYAIAVISAIVLCFFNPSLTRSTFNKIMEMEKQISYGIYTIERLPKKTRRTPKWDLHSMAKDRATAEIHAKTLAAQPYFDCIEIQEFCICPKTKERIVNRIRTYSRKTSILRVAAYALLAGVVILTGLSFF